MQLLVKRYSDKMYGQSKAVDGKGRRTAQPMTEADFLLQLAGSGLWGDV